MEIQKCEREIIILKKIISIQFSFPSAFNKGRRHEAALQKYINSGYTF